MVQEKKQTNTELNETTAYIYKTNNFLFSFLSINILHET